VLGNPGPGGWACILRYRKHERILRGLEPHTTNNRMELVAAINGLRALTEMCRVTVITIPSICSKDDGVPCALAEFGWCNSPEKPLRIGICGNCWRRWPASTNEVALGPRHGSDRDQDRCDILAKESARMAAAGGWPRTWRPDSYPLLSLYMRA